MRIRDWSSDVCSSDLVTATGVFAGARERIAADRAAGYRLVMATASYRFYVGAIAERLGFDDVIATEAEIDETGRLYAKMVGDNVYGPAKLAAIEAWLARGYRPRGLPQDRKSTSLNSSH